MKNARDWIGRYRLDQGMIVDPSRSFRNREHYSGGIWRPQRPRTTRIFTKAALRGSFTFALHCRAGPRSVAATNSI